MKMTYWKWGSFDEDPEFWDPGSEIICYRSENWWDGGWFQGFDYRYGGDGAVYAPQGEGPDAWYSSPFPCGESALIDPRGCVNENLHSMCYYWKYTDPSTERKFSYPVRLWAGTPLNWDYATNHNPWCVTDWAITGSTEYSTWYRFPRMDSGAWAFPDHETYLWDLYYESTSGGGMFTYDVWEERVTTERVYEWYWNIDGEDIPFSTLDLGNIEAGMYNIAWPITNKIYSKGGKPIYLYSYRTEDSTTSPTWGFPMLHFGLYNPDANMSWQERKRADWNDDTYPNPRTSMLTTIPETGSFKGGPFKTFGWIRAALYQVWEEEEIDE